jgi:ubiquinone/menaquinone biosynthesis C-methylase UbiE
MPRIRQNLVLNLAKDLVAFLRLDAGIGRSLPEDTGNLLKTRHEPAHDTEGSSKGLPRAPKQGANSQERLTGELLKEREKRKRAEEALKHKASIATSSDVQRQTHALPEADESLDRRQIFRSMISHLKPGQMLDLGAGSGSFSMAAAQLGWEVTAVDARTIRMQEANADDNSERARLIRSIRWVESDVRDFPIEDGEYDLICVLGLMHHLEIEDQLNLMKRCSNTLTILDCKVAPEIVVTEGPYEGFYYREMGETPEERDKIPVASWGNETSFRHTEESLIRLLHNCGYDKVMAMRPPHHAAYTFYLALSIS